VRDLGESREPLVDGNDALGAVTDRGRYVQDAWPLLARQRQDVPEKRLTLLRRVPAAADADDLRVGHYRAAARTAAS
jgi:hypothetical protein